MIHKLTKLTTRVLAILFAVCATTSAWAAAGDTVTICNDLSTGGFKTSTPTYTANDSYTITIPAVSGLRAGDYVRVTSFSFGRNSSGDTMNVAYVTSKDFLGDTIRSGNRTESGKFSKVAAWKEICAFGSAGDDNDLLLKVGTAYDFSLLNSSGAKTEQKVLAFTTTDGTYSPVAQDTTSTDTRMEQEVVCKVVSSAVVSASGTWSGLAFSNAPGDWSAASTAPVLVELTADSTLEINTDVNVESIVFAVPANVTLTLTGSKAITATTAISIKGGGSVCVAGADVLSGPVKVASGTTFTFDFDNVAAPTEESPFGDVLLSSCTFSDLGSVQFSNVPANTIASIGDCGIRLVHNGVFGKWNATGQSMYAWRSAGTSGNFSACSVAPVTTSSGAVGSTENITWGKFCNGNGSYSAPAPAFYFDSAEYSMQRTPNFSPLTIGGLLVTAGGSTIARSDGQLELGDTRSTDAKIETYFVLAQSFGLGSFGKGGSNPNKIYGTVNIEAAEGATLTLPSQGITLDTATAANLKMHGAGNIALTGTITATGNVTLDYSDVDSGNTFIRGSLTVDASTKLVLPSWLSEGTPYTLCTGTLTAPSIVTEGSVQIGDGEATTATLLYNTTAKTVAYYTSIPEFTGTVSGSTIAWNSEPTQEQYAIGKIVLTGSGDVTLPYEPVIINAGSGVTVDVTGYTTAAYSGEGTFKYTSGYPTTVPAGMTYWYVGSDDVEDPAVLDNATVSGTLLTSGQLQLGSYTQTATGSLDVLSGCTKVGSSRAVNGTLTVRSGAELAFTNGDAVNYNATTLNVNVYGTLTCGAYRQSIPTTARITFYTGSTITGSGDGSAQNDSTFDLLGTADILTFSLADGAENGTVNFNAPVSLRGSAAVTWTVDSGVTVDWAGDATKGCTSAGASDCNGSVNKAGAGTLKLSGVMHKGSVTLNAGTLDVAATQAVTMTYGAASAAMTASNGAVVTGTITAAANGSAFIAPDTSMQTFLKDSTKWQGTFSIPSCSSTSTAHLQLPLHNYGNTSSVIALAGVSNQSTSWGTWISGNNDTVNATVQLNGNVTFNQGSSGRTYTFKKITGTGNLTIAAFSLCTADGLGYVFEEINGYTGTITANNNSSTEACTFSVKIKNIVSSTTPLVKLTVGGTNEKTTIDLSEATVGGESVAVRLATNNGVSGIYLPVATYNGTSYFSLAEAIKAAGDANLADIVVADSSAEVPEGYALVGGTKVRKGGGDIYWTSGTYWAASDGSAVFSTAASGGETTTYVAGDTVVIPNTNKRWYGPISDGAKIVFSCGGPINVEKTGALGYAFKNAEITIENGTTVNFVQDGSGTDPEVNGGSISGEGAITVANGATLVLSGEVELGRTPSGGTVKVASGAEVSCTGSATISSTLAGSGEVSFATLPESALTLGDWTGTVELLPELTADQEYQLNNYGKTGSTIRINGLSAGWLAVDDTITVNANLELAGDWNLSAMSTRVYDFATVSGTGNMSFATAQHQPTSINIDTLSGYSGAITNNTTATLTIGTLALDSGADVSAGAKLLSTGGTGEFSVTAVTVGGEAQTFDLCYESDGVYVAAAEYNSVKYYSVAAAIAEAGDENLADITLLNGCTTVPDGYYIENNEVKQYQAALVDTDGEKHYFYTPQAAVDAIAQYLGVADAKTYDYYEVYYGENVAIAIDTSIAAHAAWAGVSLKIKCLAGASVAVTLASTESQLTAEDADANGIVTYTKTDKATTYVWAATAASQWARNTNWKVGTSEGATATRYPGAADTVIIGDGANITGVSSPTSVAAMQVSGAVTIVGGGTLTSANEITLGASDSITITGTLSPVPTTNVSHSRVKPVTVGDTTTYSVEVIPGTIFSVY